MILKTSQPLSWLGQVDSKTGEILGDHELKGKNLKGTDFEFPCASGSTVGSYVINELKANGVAPSRITFTSKPDSITAWGAILAGIPMNVQGKSLKTINISELRKNNVPEELMEMIHKVGQIFDYNDFIPVRSVQVAGVSYKTIAESGLNTLKYLSGKYKVRTPGSAFLNPAGMDLVNWKEQGIPEGFAKKQLEIMECFKKMGILPTCTCTPYLIGIFEPPGTELHWSESSAVCFANSVLGMRTNREGGIASLVYALAGYGPRWGYHLDENRNPTFEIKFEGKLKSSADYGILGHIIGERVKDGVPYIRGIHPEANELPFMKDRLKALGAAAAASGAVALFHAEGITPEARLKTISFGGIKETMTITEKDISERKAKLSTANYDELNLVAFGCPHASQAEIEEIARYIKGRKLKQGKKLWVCTSRQVKAWSDSMGYVKTIEDAGGKVYCDTCMVVAPISDMGFSCTGSCSGKAVCYLPTLGKQKKVLIDDTKTLIEKVTD